MVATPAIEYSTLIQNIEILMKYQSLDLDQHIFYDFCRVDAVFVGQLDDNTSSF